MAYGDVRLEFGEVAPSDDAQRGDAKTNLPGALPPPAPPTPPAYVQRPFDAGEYTAAREQVEAMNRELSAWTQAAAPAVFEGEHGA